MAERARLGEAFPLPTRVRSLRRCGDLKPSAPRFAVAETLSHLERLVLEERAAPREDL